MTRRFIATLVECGATAAVCGACSHPLSVLEPGGPAAEGIASLAWLMFGIGTAVAVIVTGLLLYAAFGARRNERDDSATARAENRLVLLGGVVIPSIVLVALFIVALRSLSAFSNERAAAELEIEIVGHQWWWEVKYPRQGFTTANEIHIPAGRPVRVEVTSADVIHSFWIPRLHGKVDLVPGRVNSIRLEAWRSGTYRGQCAEYCGLQHARMALRVVAEPAEVFAVWADGQRAAALPPADSLGVIGARVFAASCAACHTIRGATAGGAPAPDLTHLAGRHTLAAGTLPNTPESLAAWIANPQRFKPGSKMPEVGLRAEEIQAVVSYLGSLR